MDARQRKYENKIDELKKEVEKAAQELGVIHGQRDAAIQVKGTVEKERTVILDQIELNKKTLSELEENIEKRRSAGQVMITGLDESVRKIKGNIEELELKEKSLGETILSMNEKIGKLDPLVKQYDETSILLRETLDKVEQANLLLNKTYKEAEKIMSDAHNIKQAALKLKSDNEDWFRRLQSFETGLNFYAERLRRWYQGKNSNLFQNSGAS